MDTRSVQQMLLTFLNATRFNGDISGWNVSSVPDDYYIQHVFLLATAMSDCTKRNIFESWTSQGALTMNTTNSDYSSWANLLCGCSINTNVELRDHVIAWMENPIDYVCGESINSWDVSNVTSFLNVFKDLNDFNADLSGWDTSSVTDMQSTFYYTRDFTGKGLETWDTSSVTS